MSRFMIGNFANLSLIYAGKEDKRVYKYEGKYLTLFLTEPHKFLE